VPRPDLNELEAKMEMCYHYKTLQKIIFYLYHTDEPKTRNWLCMKTALARTTVYDSLAVGMREGMIRRLTKMNNPKGRPHSYFTLTKEWRTYLEMEKKFIKLKII